MAGRMNLATAMLLTGNRRRDDGGGIGRMRYGTPWQDMPHGMAYGGYGDEGMPSTRRRRDDGDGYERREDGGRRMGFYQRPIYDTDDGDISEMRRRRGARMHYGRSEADHDREPIRFGGMVSVQGGGHPRHMTREMAEEWVESMENADPAKPHGAKWTMEQIKPLAQKYGVPTEGEKFYEFWAVVNAMYSDYYLIAKKYGALKEDFFADMAMAFISDKDAVDGKAAMYYSCIVDKGE